MRTFLGAIALSSSLVTTGGAQARWTGKVDLAIGGPDETRTPYMLDMVGGLELDRAGRVLVVQPKDNSVRVYSPSGRHLFSFGRAGAGPGDLAFPCCVATDAAGRVWIQEIRNRRYSVFRINDSSAQYLYSVRAPGGSGGFMDRLRWDSRGAVLHVTTESFDRSPIKTIRHHADSSGNVIKRDTLRDAPVDSSTRVSVTRTSGGGISTSWVNVPFAPAFLRATGPDGQIVEADSGTYEIDWLDGNLKALRKITAAFDPPVVSPEERQAARDTIAAFAKNMSTQIDLNAVRIPARKPALVSLGFDLDGRLWVERSVAKGQPREADVYGPSGRLIAHATWPANVSLRYYAIRGLTALGIKADPDTDVPTIVRLTFAAR